MQKRKKENTGSLGATGLYMLLKSFLVKVFLLEKYTHDGYGIYHITDVKICSAAPLLTAPKMQTCLMLFPH